MKILKIVQNCNIVAFTEYINKIDLNYNEQHTIIEILINKFIKKTYNDKTDNFILMILLNF